MTRLLLTVFRKEFFENLRDRRTILSALVFGPLFGPILLATVLQISFDRNQAVADEPISIAVSHSERAPNLMAWLREHNIIVEAVNLNEAGARAAVLAKQHKLVIDVQPDFGLSLSSGQPAALLMYADASDLLNDRSVHRVRAVLSLYGHQIAQLRLLARGIDPKIGAPITMQEVDVSTPSSRALRALGMLSYLIILAMLMGGMYIAIDSTAGERERGSLEPLFTTPAPRRAIVFGKIMATSAYMLISLSLTVAACAIVMRFLNLESFGMRANLGPLTAIAIVGVTAPLILIGASLMTVVASFTKSYREAQTYIGFVLIVPTLPVMLDTFLNLKPTLLLMAVPSLSQHFLMTSLLRDELLNPAYLLISAGASLGLGIVLALFASWLYEREAILG